MDDACVITRPGAGPPVLNEITGVLVPPAPTTIYDATTLGEDGRSLADAENIGGMCMVSPPSSLSDRALITEGSVEARVDTYSGKIPVDAPVIREGDNLTVLSSRRDPQLVDQTYRVERVYEGTFAISRRMRLEAR